jgi:molybdenum cofactor guanylyltransferase
MQPVTLAVLAGGEGSRMGRPKGELRVGEVPILEYLLKRWDWPGPTMLVTAPGREHPPGWELFDREVRDPTAGEGPLQGIITALENAGDAPIVVVATCDMPLVTRQMMEPLVDALHDPKLLLVMSRHDTTLEPFPLALRAAALPMLRERLARQEKAVRALAEMPGFATIESSADASAFMNVNDPQEYERFLAQSHLRPR